MKVLLVALNSQYVHTNLAVRYLKAYTKEIDYDCKICEFTINHRIEQILEGIMRENPDIICFSTYIWNVNMVSDLGKLIKRIEPAIEIMYGGPEVSFDSEEFLKKSCGDYLIKGEGEETFKEFIQYKLGYIKDIENIQGFYYKKNNEVYFNGIRENIDMNRIVFPYEDDEDLENKIVYYESSRGCPFRCKYCLSSTDRNLRFLNSERVKKELKYFIDKKVKLVKFVDRTFNASHKFAMEVWKYLIEHDNGFTCFHFEISADILKEDQFKLLKGARSGLFQFEIGVQSTNDKTLKHINRMVDFQFLKEKVLRLKELGNIKQHLDLIAGLPEEDFNSFKKSFNDVYLLKPDELQLGFLKLLKGAPLIEEADKWGMAYSHIPPYEILKTNCMSYNELLRLKGIESMVDKYYNSGKFNNIIKFFINEFSNPFEFYYELSNFYREKGYFDRSISSSDYYKVFIEFNDYIFNSRNSEALSQIIKYDYICFNKKSWIPPFLSRDITKKEMQEIKEKLIKEKIIINMKECHIEKFNIDIENFLQNNVLINSQVYAIFQTDNGKIIHYK